MISDVEQFSYTCWPLHIFFGKMSIKYLYPFLSRLFKDFGIELYVSLCYFEYQSHFLQFYRLPFHWVYCFFCCVEVFNQIQPQLLILLLLFMSYPKNCSQDQCQGVFPRFSSRSFMISGFMLIHLCECIRQRSNFILLHVVIQFFITIY